jgi:hypothetical protein
MLRPILLAAMLAVLPSAAAAPALAITAKQRMETCKFGADDQKLTGAARNAFIRKCMAPGEPPGTGGPAKPQKPKS